MEEVVAIWSRAQSDFFAFNFYCASHAGKGIYNLWHVKVRTQKLVDCAKSCFCCRLEIVRNHDVLSKTSVIRMADKNRFNFVALISKVAGNDVCRQNKVFNIVTGKLNHKVFVANLNGTQSCRVDNWCHRKDFVFSVAQKRKLRLVCQNPAKVFSFWMICQNLTAGHRLVALEWNKACFVRVNSVIFYREFNLVDAVNSHRK